MRFGTPSPTITAMRYIFEGLLVLHLVAWAIVLGGWLLNVRSAQPVRGTFHGALTALVTGLLMAGMIGLNLVDDNVDWRKLVAKFVIALVVTALAWEAHRNPERESRVSTTAIGSLTLVNVFLAVFWN